MIQRAFTAIASAAVLVAGLVIPAAAQVPVRVGGDIKEPRRIKDVKPVYPPIAQQANVQGIVILEIIVGEDGKVREARVLRPVPLLDQAALDAVQQWEYTPTLLNGQPVAVVMTVTVTFSLAPGTGAGTAPQTAAADVSATLDYAKAVHARGLLAETEAALQRALAAVQAERARVAVQNASVISLNALPPNAPVRVGGSVIEPRRLTHVTPTFPPGAPAGISIVEVIIGVDGRVTDAKILRGSTPEVDAAVVSAVRQWVYTPTLLNGQPVPVVMTVTVTRTIK